MRSAAFLTLRRDLAAGDLGRLPVSRGSAGEAATQGRYGSLGDEPSPTVDQPALKPAANCPIGCRLPARISWKVLEEISADELLRAASLLGSLRHRNPIVLNAHCNHAPIVVAKTQPSNHETTLTPDTLHAVHYFWPDLSNGWGVVLYTVQYYTHYQKEPRHAAS